MSPFGQGFPARFSLVAGLLLLALALVLVVPLCVGINQGIELLEAKGNAVGGGGLDIPDPGWISQTRSALQQTWWDTLRRTAGGFLLLHLGLVALVWLGWRSLRRQQAALQRAHARSEAMLQVRNAELTSANETLRGKRERAELLLEAMGEGIMAVDAAGRITFCNPAGASVLGREVADVIGRPHGDLVHPQGPDGTPYPEEGCPIEQTLREATVRQVVKAVFARGDGSSFPVEYVTTPLGKGENLAGAVMAFRDTTEQRRAEEALALRTAELQRSNEELELFAYAAAHDLQEPLRSIASYTQLLARRYQGRLDAKADQYIAYAVEGAARLKRLINDLLAYARVASRGQPFQPTDCNAAFDQAVADLGAMIAEHGAVVTRERLPTVSADAAQLVHLFQNLIGNAVKFHGGKPPRVHVTAEVDGEEWVVAVRDNGIGIDPRHAERIFVIFERLHTEDEYPGTGTGLAICKRIVQRHAGSIWVESALGTGATFRFTLPRNAEREPAAPLQSWAAVTGERLLALAQARGSPQEPWQTHPNGPSATLSERV